MKLLVVLLVLLAGCAAPGPVECPRERCVVPIGTQQRTVATEGTNR